MNNNNNVEEKLKEIGELMEKMTMEETPSEKKYIDCWNCGHRYNAEKEEEFNRKYSFMFSGRWKEVGHLCDSCAFECKVCLAAFPKSFRTCNSYIGDGCLWCYPCKHGHITDCSDSEEDFIL